MELSAADIAQLEAYWQQELPAAERLAIEQRLNTDPDFREAARQLQQLQSGLLLLQRQQWKAQLEQIEAAAPPPELSSPRWPVQKILIVSGIFLAVIVTFFLLFRIYLKTRPTPEQAIALEAFEHFPYYGATLDNAPATAVQLYEKERDYQEAERAFQQLFVEQRDSTYLLYAAIAAVGSNQPEKGIATLEALLKSPRFVAVREDVEWYLALGYLERGMKDKAKKMLEGISGKAGKWGKKKKEILNRIK
ncbi:MAG TPA: hypothetical protein PLC89_06140 [Haliscomenobacter sp.]|uniref:hypothetical protein n=1 Tax=Haliscomenobacter sp. TaxID=2717303 RepID=UPI002C1B8220|nr:hypothetical protein [Haliscomenobacter sp.]HOY16848.1 hypothetical protein [Haliscomenobacter sp.]HPH17526.1 hypothetical protein [Haliscomenobacter sp.]